MQTRFFLVLVFVVLGTGLLGWQAPQQQMPPPSEQPPAPAQPQPAAPSPPPRPTLSVVVLDPAHGGADAGARGSAGVLESEVVLSLARVVREELERQGLRVVQTRQGNENPSFDDRSAKANGLRGALFISLHVSSTGPPGTARAYSFAAPAVQRLKPATSVIAPAGLLLWDRAQEPYMEMSRRFAQLLQVQLAQKFRGSAEVAPAATVRQLRTVGAPAVAVEISSVSGAKRSELEQMAPTLAEAVSRAVAAFRTVYESEAR